MDGDCQSGKCGPERNTYWDVLLHEPNWIFADDATASLDEPTEKLVYQVLRERLPDATLVSISQRPAVLAYHEKRWTLVPKPEGHFELQTA